jgi:hypothetical protein
MRLERIPFEPELARVLEGCRVVVAAGLLDGTHLLGPRIDLFSFGLRLASGNARQSTASRSRLGLTVIATATTRLCPERP